MHRQISSSCISCSSHIFQEPIIWRWKRKPNKTEQKKIIQRWTIRNNRFRKVPGTFLPLRRFRSVNSVTETNAVLSLTPLQLRASLCFFTHNRLKRQKHTLASHSTGQQAKSQQLNSGNRYLHEYFMQRGHRYLASSSPHVSHLKEAESGSWGRGCHAGPWRGTNGLQRESPTAGMHSTALREHLHTLPTLTHAVEMLCGTRSQASCGAGHTARLRRCVRCSQLHHSVSAVTLFIQRIVTSLRVWHSHCPLNATAHALYGTEIPCKSLASNEPHRPGPRRHEAPPTAVSPPLRPALPEPPRPAV